MKALTRARPQLGLGEHPAAEVRDVALGVVLPHVEPEVADPLRVLRIGRQRRRAHRVVGDPDHRLDRLRHDTPGARERPARPTGRQLGGQPPSPPSRAPGGPRRGRGRAVRCAAGRPGRPAAGARGRRPAWPGDRRPEPDRRDADPAPGEAGTLEVPAGPSHRLGADSRDLDAAAGHLRQAVAHPLPLRLLRSHPQLPEVDGEQPPGAVVDPGGHEGVAEPVGQRAPRLVAVQDPPRPHLQGGEPLTGALGREHPPRRVGSDAGRVEVRLGEDRQRIQVWLDHAGHREVDRPDGRQGRPEVGRLPLPRPGSRRPQVLASCSASPTESGADAARPAS